MSETGLTPKGKIPPPQSPPKGGKFYSLSLWERVGVRVLRKSCEKPIHHSFTCNVGAAGGGPVGAGGVEAHAEIG